mmetsp:Transcript_47646/g.146989  ORF Transcript_47646/g.146989 Transcript_47646/m.146989 type:complete len:216 (-) Transcript_47646:608-1255(-)
MKRQEAPKWHQPCAVQCAQWDAATSGASASAAAASVAAVSHLSSGAAVRRHFVGLSHSNRPRIFGPAMGTSVDVWNRSAVARSSWRCVVCVGVASASMRMCASRHLSPASQRPVRPNCAHWISGAPVAASYPGGRCATERRGIVYTCVASSASITWHFVGSWRSSCSGSSGCVGSGLADGGVGVRWCGGLDTPAVGVVLAGLLRWLCVNACWLPA